MFQWRFKREGTYVYFWLMNFVVWQKPTQHCKAIILQEEKKKEVEGRGCWQLRLGLVNKAPNLQYCKPCKEIWKKFEMKPETYLVSTTERALWLILFAKSWVSWIQTDRNWWVLKSFLQLKDKKERTNQGSKDGYYYWMLSFRTCGTI